MAGVESLMIKYVCATDGFLFVPFIPFAVLVNIFDPVLFGFAWATVLLIFVILSASPCASYLNCARVSQGTVSTSLAMQSIIASGPYGSKRIVLTGASGFSDGILHGANITIAGATHTDFNGTFEVSLVTATTIEIRSTIAAFTEDETSATITSYENFKSYRDGEKAVSKSVLIYYLVFLFLAVWGKLFLCKTPGQKGYLGGAADGLSKTYIIPNTTNAAEDAKAALAKNADFAKLQQRAIASQDQIIKAAQAQVERANARARELVASSSTNDTSDPVSGTANIATGVASSALGAVTSVAGTASSFLESLVSPAEPTQPTR